ncbi:MULTISPECIES: hypothetical protein [unclassified Pseudofrankia]|uniref:hypothetical protein n=1 Tax=unclassified Pseudofrankia TaxID=2994372 RepID=UPI0008D9BD64|nr:MULTISPECIES: hypothetical protein [unclassified Pseudofrankia]MDT3441809.1 hypothetical protein [Pseudofrankia sp. BMG5.37]OHV47096.1 hypothetical protein BCD48_20370 [Pseudofrankia sp. BMG5.36]
MHEMTLSGLGSGVSAKDMIVTGIGLTALSVCLGRARTALFVAIPTLILAGAANVIAWLTGADGNTPGGTGPASTAPTGGLSSKAASAASAGALNAESQGSSHPLPWVLALLAAALVALLIAGIVRRTRARTVEGAGASDDDPPLAGTDPLNRVALGGDQLMAADPYPDLPLTEKSGWDVADHGDADGDGGWSGQPDSAGWRRRHRPSTDSRPGTDADHYSARMNRLAVEFVTGVVPRPGSAARIDLHAPTTQSFLTAFTNATDLFLGAPPRDRRLLPEALSEAERCWLLAKRGPGGHRHGDNPDSGRAAGP